VSLKSVDLIQTKKEENFAGESLSFTNYIFMVTVTVKSADRKFAVELYYDDGKYIEVRIGSINPIFALIPG